MEPLIVTRWRAGRAAAAPPAPGDNASLLAADHELRAAGELVADGFAAATGLIRQLHSGIADRAFGAAGPGAATTRVTHDAIAGAAYGAVAVAGRALGRAAAAAVAVARPDQAHAISRSPRGRLTAGAINGLLGDRLERDGSPLAVRMAVRVAGEDVPVTRAALREAFPDATRSLAVFVHGLCESDEAWRLGVRPSYGERLREDLGITPLLMRYNSGRHISENGADLDRLLEELIAAWPVYPYRIALIGHSMGGLVLRSAAHAAGENGHRWPKHVRNVVFLGSPHLGAPLERGAAIAADALGRVPEGRPIATVLKTRSAGIKDLRFGAITEDDWRNCDPDAIGPDPCRDIPLLRHARHHCVMATLRPSEEGLFANTIGDVLVPPWSASGRGRGRLSRSIPFDPDDSLHVPGASHFALLNHPRVYDQLKVWLDG